MVSFDPDNDPRIIRSIECGVLDVAEDARTLVPEPELQAALDRHLNLDFGEKTADEELYNLAAVTFGMGTVRSCYPTADGRDLHIHTDLQRGETKVFVDEEP